MPPLSGHRAPNRDPAALHQMQRGGRVHNKQESVGQGKGGIAVVGEPGVSASALARSEMAREKARIARRKSARPSTLQQTAEEWKSQQEQRERLRFQPGPEASLASPQRIRLPALTKTHPRDEGIQWRARRLGGEGSTKPLTLNAAMVSRIAQHLKAREWTRARGKRQGTPLGSGLEKWAETWRRNKELEEKRLAGSPTLGDSRRPA